MPPARRYICSFCAKSFSRSEHKSRHERSHTNEKPFSCSICFSKFVRRDLLQRHLRTVHNESNTSKLINIIPSSGSTTPPSATPDNLSGGDFSQAAAAQGACMASQKPRIPSTPHNNFSESGREKQQASSAHANGSPSNSTREPQRRETVSQIVPFNISNTDTIKVILPAEESTAQNTSKESSRQDAAALSTNSDSTQVRVKQNDDRTSGLAADDLKPNADATPSENSASTKRRGSISSTNEALSSSTIVSSNFYSLSERNLILLLTLAKKFSKLDLRNGTLVDSSALPIQPLVSNSKISNYLISWGTVSNIKFPIVLNLNKLLTLSATPLSSAANTTVNKSSHTKSQNNSVFNSALFHAVLSFGAAESGQFYDSISLYNTCWMLITRKLSQPEEIIEPLTILAYIALNFLQELHFLEESSTVSIHKIFKTLNECIYLLISNKFVHNPLTAKNPLHGSISMSALNYYKSHALPVPPEILSLEATSRNLNSYVESELFNYWYIYTILSSYTLYFNTSPPKIHILFLNKILPTNNDYHLMSTETKIKSVNKQGNNVIDINKRIDFLSNETLKDALTGLSKSPSLLKNMVALNHTDSMNALSGAIFPNNTFKNLTLRESCIVFGLSNELQCLICNESTNLFPNKNVMHNSIIIANKSLNTNSNFQKFTLENQGASCMPTSSNIDKTLNDKSTEFSLFQNVPYSSHVATNATASHSHNVASFGSRSHGVHSPNEPNLNIVNRTTINSNSSYMFNINNFSNMIVNNNINQDLINMYNYIILLKKRVLVNCDKKLIQDLLIDYIIIPNHETYWNLLYITIKEFTFTNSGFISSNDKPHETHDNAAMVESHPNNRNKSSEIHLSSFTSFIFGILKGADSNITVSELLGFLLEKNVKHKMVVNNNLGLTSLPILFIGYLIYSSQPGLQRSEGDINQDMFAKFITINSSTIPCNNLIFLRYFLKLPKNFINLLVETFLVLIKIFCSFRKEVSVINTNSHNINDNESEDSLKRQKIKKINPDVENIINSPITQSIFYLINEMGIDLNDDPYIMNFVIQQQNSGSEGIRVTADSFKPEKLLEPETSDDLALYFYLRSIEKLFITWIKFIDIGKNYSLQASSNYPLDNNSLLENLVRHIQISMTEIYRNLNLGQQNDGNMMISNPIQHYHVQNSNHGIQNTYVGNDPMSNYRFQNPHSPSFQSPLNSASSYNKNTNININHGHDLNYNPHNYQAIPVSNYYHSGKPISSHHTGTSTLNSSPYLANTQSIYNSSFHGKSNMSSPVAHHPIYPPSSLGNFSASPHDSSSNNSHIPNNSMKASPIFHRNVAFPGMPGGRNSGRNDNGNTSFDQQSQKNLVENTANVKNSISNLINDE